MKRRKGIIAMAILMLLTIFRLLSQLDTYRISAQQAETKAENRQKAMQRSSRVKRVIKGSESPDEIPDMVAYELFLLTVAEGNARGLVRQAGITEEQTEAVMLNAYALKEDFIEPINRQAFDLKSNRRNLSKPQVTEQLAGLQAKKDQVLERFVDRYFSDASGEDGMPKLTAFIQDHVKRNIQKVLLFDSGKPNEFAFNSPFAKSFVSNKQSGGSQLYLYSDGWQEGMNAFGSGSLSEQYGSNTSYRVSVTITSPNGRTNTTESDWNFATLVSNSGLSIGVEDGTYSVNASFNEQSGYYDEYGNFNGTGASYVGSSLSSALVAPTIVLGPAFVTPSLFFLTGNPPSGGGTGVVSATISATQGVPEGTTVEFDFLETVNGGGVSYSVTAGQSTGHQPHPSGNRQTRRLVPRTGEIALLSSLFTINLGSSSNLGAVTNLLRINKIIAVPPNGTGGVIGENQQVPAVFTLSAPPTPNPSPTPPGGGGGCNNTKDGEPVKNDGKLLNLENCSPCNPSPYELQSCFGSGGVYDWAECYCGNSPIVLDILGNGYDLTNLANGIFFDLTATGQRIPISWTAPASDDAWLVLDRNQNNQIDDGKEMFGNISEQPVGQNPKQGFATLGLFDTAIRGGNGDGKITRSDAIFRRLRLWVDRNHNGVSEPEELFRLPALDVVALDLDYRASNRTDKHGNKFKYRVKVRDRLNARVGRWAWDVFLITGR